MSKEEKPKAGRVLKKLTVRGDKSGRLIVGKAIRKAKLSAVNKPAKPPRRR